MGRRRSVLAFAAIAAAAMAAAGQPALAAGHGAVVDRGTLHELNDSGVRGRVTLVQKDGEIRANLNVHGLEAGRLHVHHIHGHADRGQATCPDMSAAGADGVLSVADGLPAYGPVVITLGTDVTNGSTLAYSRTFQDTDDPNPVVDSIAAMGDLDQFVVVVHGLTVDDDNDSTTPESFVASTPVACAVLTDHGH